MDIRIATPDQNMLLAVSEKHRAAVECIVIDSDIMLAEMSDEVGRADRFKKVLQEQQKSILAPLKEAEERVREMFRRPLELVEDVSKAGRKAIGVWLDEQQAKRQAEQRRLEDLARQERQRLAAEAAEIEKQVWEKASAARAASDEAMAREIEEAGQAQAAEIAAIAAVTVAPIVEAAPKVAGLSARRPWKGRVIDMQKLVEFIAANPVWLDLLEVNQAKLHAQAKALELRLGAVLPGTEPYQETIIARRVS